MSFLDNILLKYGTELSLENISSLHSFLTAVVSGPNLLPPSYWLPAIWGNEEDQPAWADMHETQRFMDAVFNMMNNISETLRNTPQSFATIFTGGEYGSPVSDWCIGYLDGIELDEEAWLELPAHLLTQVDFLDEQIFIQSIAPISHREQIELNDTVISSRRNSILTG